MKKNLMNLIIFTNLDENTAFYFKNGKTRYRYISLTTHRLSDDQKNLVVVFNENKKKYEILDLSIGSQLYNKEVLIDFEF